MECCCSHGTASEDQFRTGWFIESLFTELFILLVVRTRRPLFKSKPGLLLWVSTLLVGLGTLILPYLPGVGPIFGFVPLPPLMMALLLAITALVCRRQRSREAHVLARRVGL